MSDRVFHVISNTHWDREWRFPYQRNRQMLVEMLDEVLDILESEPDYRAYHLDSQSIMVTDYLEARPHKKELLTEMVRSKRLLIGPWYTLPDEYMVGGENLVRNLLRGHEVCEQFGGVSKIGYSPFSWGQISQLPQLYREFGIDLIMFYRGINSIDSPKAEFIWEGADGTRALSSRFSTWPRYNFYFYIYRPVVHGEQPADIEYRWSNGGRPFHFADKEQSGEDYFMTRYKDGYTPENIRESVEKIIRDQADDFTTRHVIWMEGHDSSGPNAKTVQLLRDIRKEFPDLDIRHSTLEEYAKHLAEEIDHDNLSLVKGERRSAQYDHRSANLYGYALSARMYLKQANFNAERWIQHYAEPLNCFMGMAGLDINDRYPEMAWDLLIQNSAHDSIGGCSLDPIHEDMMYRFRHSEEISRGMYDRAAKHLAGSIDLSDEDPDSIHIVAVNTTQYGRSEVVEAVIDVPQEFDKGGIKLQDRSGNTLPFQLIERSEVQPILEQPVNRPMYFSMVRYRVHMLTPDIPAMGFDSVKVLPVSNNVSENKQNDLHESENSAAGAAGEDTTAGAAIASGKGSEWKLENDHLSVKINRDGTLDVTDKSRNKTYRNQAWFYDEGEAGHAWVHEAIGPFTDTKGTTPEISLTENGPLKASVLIRHVMSLPADLQARKSGSSERVDMPVTLEVSLSHGQKWPELSVEVDNTAESHRLRIMFPLGLNAGYSWGEGQFDVVKRETRRIDSHDWVEQPMYDYPMHHFVDVANDSEGTAVLVDGLKEYEVRDDEDQTLAVTLMRSFEYRIPVASEVDYSGMKGTQCFGKQQYRLAFYPHEGNWESGGVFEQAFRFNYALRMFETGPAGGDIAPGTSFLNISPSVLTFSSIKKAQGSYAGENGTKGPEGQFVLRLYNPSDRPVSGEITSWFPVKKATQLTLEEKPAGELSVREGRKISIDAASRQIVTILLEY